jgi:hypothetical protein
MAHDDDTPSQELYDSEINFELRSELSVGFEWKLGE